MDIKELLAKCEELELKEDGIDNVVTGLTSLIADDDEWDELGEYIINTSRMYDKFCQPAMKKIRVGKGDEIDWRKIAIEGARMYAREIEPLHLDGDGYKKTAEYLKDYYTNLAKSGISESVNNELIIEWDFINPNGNSENDTIDAKLIIKKEEDGTFSWKETYDDAHAEGFETAGEAYENAVENENNVEGAYGLSDYDGFQIDKDYDEVVAFFGENIAEDFKPAKMKKAEYKEIDIKEPEVEKLKEEKDLAETPAEMKQAKYKDMKIEKPEVEPLKEEVAEKITFKLGDADVEVSNDTKEEFTAEEIKAVIEKENPPIFFSDADSYHYIMDFSFEKNGKKYWIESKHIEGDFSKFELNIYEGINESIAGSLIKELNLLESKEVGNIIPAEMEKAEYDEIKPTKILADENGKKVEKELKEEIKSACKKVKKRGSKSAKLGESNKRHKLTNTKLKTYLKESVSNWERDVYLPGTIKGIKLVMPIKYPFTFEDGTVEKIYHELVAYIYKNKPNFSHKYGYEITLANLGDLVGIVATGDSDSLDEVINLCVSEIKQFDKENDTNIIYDVRPLEPSAEDIKYLNGEGLKEDANLKPSIAYDDREGKYVCFATENGGAIKYTDTKEDAEQFLIDKYGIKKEDIKLIESKNDELKNAFIGDILSLKDGSTCTVLSTEYSKDRDVKRFKVRLEDGTEKYISRSEVSGLIKDHFEDKTVRFMNKLLHYEFFNKRSAGDFLTLEVGKGELKYNGEDYHIFVGHNIDTKQFKFTVIFDENPEKNCDIMDSFLKDDISKADLENLKNAIYDEYIVNEDLDDEKEPTKVTVKVSDVEWDTDDEEVDLPKEFTLTVDHYDDTDLDDEVSDAISDEYGFCHFGFNYIVDGQGVNEEYINPTIFYSVERLVEGGNPDNIQDFDRIDQFDTFEQADDYIKRHIVDEETGLAIISSIYTYDNVTETPDEDLNSLKIEKFVPANKPMGETRADKIRKGIRKRVVREDNKANPTQDGCGEFRYQIGDYIRMTRKAQAEGRRLFGANFKSIKGEILDRFQGNLEMNLPNTYVVKMEDGTEESVAETLVEYWGTKRKKESVGESVKNPIESIHTGRNIYIKLNPEFENISLSELFKIIELGGTEETNSFWRTVIREKRGHITIKRNENESNELMFYPNTWKDKNFKIKTVAGVPFEDTFHAYGFAKNESFEDKTINEEEKTYYLYAGYYELYLTDHKLTPPYMYQAENTDLNQLINDNISEIDDEGKWTNPDAAFSTDSATICFDKNIIDELNKTDLFGGEIDMYHDALSDAEFNGEDEDKVKEDYHIYDLSKYYADKNESMNEVSLENAVDSNDKRQYNSLKAELKAKASGEEADEKEAEKLADKATKSNELLKRWKKAKGFKESAEIVVAKFDEGLHEIVKCDKGYFNRYNIKDGKARFTTQCVESLPTALGALKKRFPNACEDQMKVTESLKEEWVNFEGYKFKGIVNPKSGEIIYSKLTPKTKRITQADIKININDKESLENKEVIQAAKKAIN